MVVRPPCSLRSLSPLFYRGDWGGWLCVRKSFLLSAFVCVGPWPVLKVLKNLSEFFTERQKTEFSRGWTLIGADRALKQHKIVLLLVKALILSANIRLDLRLNERLWSFFSLVSSETVISRPDPLFFHPETQKHHVGPCPTYTFALLCDLRRLCERKDSDFIWLFNGDKTPLLATLTFPPIL